MIFFAIFTRVYGKVHIKGKEMSYMESVMSIYMHQLSQGK